MRVCLHLACTPPGYAIKDNTNFTFSVLFLLYLAGNRFNLSAGIVLTSTIPVCFHILTYSFRSPSLFYPLTVRVEVVYFHLITLRHTPQSVGLLWTRDRPVAETST
jgi:hypothetical protein